MDKRAHRHLIVKATVATPPKTQNDVEGWMLKTIHDIDMKIMSGPHFKYATEPINAGWTGIAIIEFSHVSIHVWENDELPLLEIDVFSCKEFEIDPIIENIKKFNPMDISILYLNRDNDFGANEKFWVFYKTTNNLNGKYYYGIHGANCVDKKYLGSGKALWNAIKKYGKENFSTELLKFFQDEKTAYEYEERFLTKTLLKDSNCYNIAKGGNGWQKTIKDMAWITNGVENKYIERSLAADNYIVYGWVFGRTAWNKNKPHSDSHKKNLKKNHSSKQLGYVAPNKGKKFSVEQREKMSKAHLGQKPAWLVDTEKKKAAYAKISRKMVGNKNGKK